MRIYILFFALAGLVPYGLKAQKKDNTAPARAAAAPEKQTAIRLENEAYEAMDSEKDYDKAIRLYRQLLQQDPRNSRAYFNIAWMMANQDRFRESIEVSNTALQYITGKKRGDFYRMIGNCHTELKELDQGMIYLKKAVALDADDVMAIYNLGYNRYAAHQYKDAVYWLKQALDKGYGDMEDPADTYFYIGTSLAEQKDYEQALVYYDKAIATNNFVNYYFNKAEALVKLNRLNDALKVCDEAIRENPDNAGIYFKRHQVYRHMDNIIRSQADLKKAYSLNPDDPDILLDMGVMHASNNEVDKALTVYRKALTYSDADKPAIYGNMANIFSGNSRWADSAVYYYRKAIEIAPEKASYYFNFGNYYKDKKDYTAAISMYEKAIKVNPALMPSYNNLAVCYNHLKQKEKAISILKKGLELDPSDYELNANMVGIAADAGDYAAADQYATQALLSIPKGKSKIDLLSRRGYARQMLGAYDNALYDYLEILDELDEKEKQANSTVYSNIGYCYLGKKDWVSALKYFEMAMKYEQSVDPAIGLMTAHYVLGNQSQFRKAREKAIQLEPQLKKGMKGIEKLEEDGYFYTKENKEILREIFSQ